MRVVTLNFTFKHTEGSDAIRSYAEEKIVPTIQKFVHHDTEAHIVLKVEKARHIVEISFHVDGHDFACHAESDDMYASIDKLSGTLAEQLRRHKDKLTRH
jgi:putative sigma-54 modulation protein